ncbi:MAG: Twin-arginine translocation protein TatA [uncultured Thiotrichaceae bacterium]|uniref:Sec-independent protein translocase protein TatA n=1 Tax=uncultured Thiotrichaceae bacterium TaxID=298394 RepID=A0A6S6U4R6_9GAMM|nr:MAG: Twin-arginine translocation protein TatA [uncultured Thiotrichaceae bacterium]
MGFGGISPWSLLIILFIILLLFGTKRLRNMGGDLGGAFKSFKKSMKDGEETENNKDAADVESTKVTHNKIADGDVIDVEVTKKETTDTSNKS